MVSPDQSESKNTEQGLTFTDALIFCCSLLETTCCQNNAIESHKSVMSIIKLGILQLLILMCISVGASCGIL